MLPAISLIMPTKNRAKLLPEVLDSILGQTFTSWELIVVDDHGTDNTEQVIEAIGDPRIFYFPLTEGTGPGRGRAFAISKARADLIGFTDSDDINLPDRLELSVEALKSPETDVVYG